jgi:predicted nucleic acid-binding protein
LIAGGPPGRILEEAAIGRIELVVPDCVLEELERVLREKLGFSADQLSEALRLVSELATGLPAVPAQAEAVTEDPNDDVILACAVAANVDVIVTGDKRHLLPLGSYAGIRVLAPQTLLKELTPEV